MTAHSVLNVRAALEWGNSELYRYYERNGLGYGTVHPDTNNDDPLADQAAATNPALFDMDPTQPGEIRLHSWMLYTSQAPVLDLTNNSVRTTKDFEQAFSELNLCSEPEDESTHGRKASRSKERKANRK